MSNTFSPRLYWNISDAAQSDTDVIIPKSDNLIQYAYEKFRTPLSSVFFILDFTQDKYLEIGPERILFTGYTSDYVKAMGPTNWIGTWIQKDFKVMNEEIIPQNKMVNKVEYIEKTIHSYKKHCFTSHIIFLTKIRTFLQTGRS